MNLMENETVLLELTKQLTLTTHRLRYQTRAMNDVKIKSIMLDELASCAMTQTGNGILLVLALLAFLGGLFISVSEANKEGALIIGLIFAAILIIAYFATRRQVLSLASAGATIRLNTHGAKLDAVKDFIEQTEAAKNLRYLGRFSSTTTKALSASESISVPSLERGSALQQSSSR